MYTKTDIKSRSCIYIRKDIRVSNCGIHDRSMCYCPQLL